MPDTLDDWLERWPTRKGPATEEEVQRLVEEIERLRKDNHAFQLRIQDAWKRIETLEQDPPVDQQVALVKAWGWAHVANHHDADPDRDGPDVKRCSHLDVDWCSQRTKGRMVPVFRPPTRETPVERPPSPSESPAATGQPADDSGPQEDPPPGSCWVRSSCGAEVKIYLHHETGVPWPGIGEFGWCGCEGRGHRAVEIEVIE